MNNNQFIQVVKDWLISDRDYTDARILFERTNEYINARSVYDVSEFVVRRTYSKGTDLHAYGYYTKSVFHTKCVVNTKRGRLINYKPWYRAGAFYNFEYGFDADSKLIETKQYVSTLPRDFQTTKGAKEYKIYYYTVIEYCENDEVALTWYVYSNHLKTDPYLELVTVTINTGSEEVTVENHCRKKGNSLLTAEIEINIYNRVVGRLDRYTLLKSQNPYGRLKEMYQDGIIKICDVYYLDNRMHI